MATRNAAPRTILKGIQDKSGRPPVIDPEEIPSHLPHVFIYAERGPLDPQLVVGGSRTAMYGANSFDLRGNYANHQTVLANTVNARGNQCLVQRVVPENVSRKAAIGFAIELVEEYVQAYMRDESGQYMRDENGELILDDGTFQGHVARWVTYDPLDNESQRMGQTPKRVGGLSGAGGEIQSTFFPMMEFEVSHFGEYGNRVGIRLSAPTVDSSDPIDEDTVTANDAYLYRAHLVERPSNSFTGLVQQTLSAEQSVNFSLKEGVIDDLLDEDLYLENILLDSYRDNEAAPQVFGPFDKQHVYNDNIKEVLDRIYLLESEENDNLPGINNGGDFEDGDGEGFNDNPISIPERHLINLFTGEDMYGVPYYTFQIRGPEHGGLLMTESSTHYAFGGTDGDMNLEDFATQVGNICANYDKVEWPFLDDAQYPQSVIYDSGFPISTKYQLLYPMGIRKDMYTVLGTYVSGEDQLTASEETAVAVALRAAARAYPESEVYGTSTCRAIVIAQSGELLNSPYKERIGLVIEFADKCAQYMGAGNGVWKTGLGFDVPGQNHVTMFKDVNNAYKPARARNKDWDAGMVWAQSYGRRSLFFPAVQTVYNDDTSVLNGALTMIAAVELEKVAQRVWRDLTGISYLSNAQFIERSDRLIADAVRGRFDGRFVIEPNTTIEGNDELRGYSWSTEITIYAANMKTVGSVTITSRRIDDLETA